ncbi:unnamed protein product [Effrenium voratum]|nr:unnamed protein product [Effrenium voratum]
MTMQEESMDPKWWPQTTQESTSDLSTTQSTSSLSLQEDSDGSELSWPKESKSTGKAPTPAPVRSWGLKLFHAAIYYGCIILTAVVLSFRRLLALFMEGAPATQKLSRPNAKLSWEKLTATDDPVRLAREVLPEPPNFPMPDKEDFTITFGPCANLMIYTGGVACCLQRCPNFEKVKPKLRFHGNSCGAFVASVMAADVEMLEMLPEMISWTKRFKYRLWGLVGAYSASITAIVWRIFSREENFRRSKDRLSVGVTTWEPVPGRRCIDSFSNVQELVTAVLGSCYIPVAFEVPQWSQEHGPFWDGGIFEFASQGDVVASPYENVLPDVGPETPYPKCFSFFPPHEADAVSLFEDGYMDCLRWLQKGAPSNTTARQETFGCEEQSRTIQPLLLETRESCAMALNELTPKPRVLPPLDRAPSDEAPAQGPLPRLPPHRQKEAENTRVDTDLGLPKQLDEDSEPKDGKESRQVSKDEARSEPKDNGKESQVSKDEARSQSKGRWKGLRKSLSRMDTRRLLADEAESNEHLRGYLDLLYRQAEQHLLWVKLDAQPSVEVRKPVFEASRTSYSQTRGRTTSAFDAANEDQEFDLDSLTVSAQLRRFSNVSLDARVRRQSAFVIQMAPDELDEEEDDVDICMETSKSEGEREASRKATKESRVSGVSGVSEVEHPLLGDLPRPLVVVVGENRPELVEVLLEFRADVNTPYEGENNWKGWIKPGQPLLASVSNRKGRFIGTMLADRLGQIEELLFAATEPAEVDELKEEDGTASCMSGRSAFGTISATWGTEVMKRPRHTVGHPKGIYEILEHLGEGDTSSVWAGFHLQTSVSVAIKIEPKTDEAGMWEEIQLMRNLRHPNVCRLFETFESETQVFVVLELCQGGRLYDVICVEGQVMREPRILRQLAQAVACLHDHKISHRDIQLENFLLAELDAPVEQATVRLIDFTTAKEYGNGHILMTKICTPTYVAKEILTRKMEAYTEKVDIWSLGVVFYIMFSGHPPFIGDSDFDVLKQVKKGHWSFEPADAWEDAPEEAMDLIQRMIVPAAERFSAQEVLSHAFLSH